MDPKSLTEAGWKALAQKFKVKDNGLQKALATYQALDEDEHDQRLKLIGSIGQFANSLKRSKEIAGKEDVLDYLSEVTSAAESQKREIAKQKAAVEKAVSASAKAVAKRQGQEDNSDEDEAEKKGEEDDEGEDETVDSYQKLASTLKALKTAKKPYYFLACDSKPYGLVVSKRDIRQNAQAKKELSQISGGSKRPPRFGECHFDSGKYVFEMRKPPAGLARILQKWIKDATGINLRVMVGAESGDEPENDAAGRRAEDQPDTETQTETSQGETGASRAASDEQEDAGSAASDLEDAAETETARQGEQAARPQPAPSPAERPTLEKAPNEWHQTRDLVEGRIGELKEAIRQEFAGEGENLLAEIEKGMNKMDTILVKLDKSLSESLAKANAASSSAARKAELNNAKTILTNYINYVKSEPLISQIDTNPFGVSTELKKTLVEKLRHMAQAIG